MAHFQLIVVILGILESKSTAIDIKSFQPAIIPIQSVTKLTIAIADQLNSSSSIQCRFNDISMPAQLKNNLVFCDTPPMRNTDKVVLHLEVDGKFHKARTPLRFHKPFKVTGISPKAASPSQQLNIPISGITCEKWMTFFVRFQTANGTKHTQKGICVNSTVTCYIPEFPAHTLLRVGVTLSNRIVEWSPTKLHIQYPIDSKKSSVKDLIPDIHKRGAFTFRIVLRDKFKNAVSIDKERESGGFSVQYSPYNQPKAFHFLNCIASIAAEQKGSAFAASCGGAKHERILVYPLINNVVVGEKSSYEVSTTLCPGKTSCSANSQDNKMAAIIVSCILATVVLIIFATLYKYRSSILERTGRWKLQRKSIAVDLDEGQSPEIAMTMFSSTDNCPLLRDNETDPRETGQFTKSLLDTTKDAADNRSAADGLGIETDDLAFVNIAQQPEMENELKVFTWDGLHIDTDESLEFARKMEHSLEPVCASGKETDLHSKNASENEQTTERSSDSTDGQDTEIKVGDDSITQKVEHSTEFIDAAAKETGGPPEVKLEQKTAHSTKSFCASSTAETDSSSVDEIGLNIKHSTESFDRTDTEGPSPEINDGSGTNEACDDGIVQTMEEELKLSYVDDMAAYSSEEEDEVPLKHQLMVELKKRLRMKYRRSKVEDNTE